MEKLESIMLYRKGIAELEKGMAINLTGEGTSEFSFMSWPLSK